MIGKGSRRALLAAALGGLLALSPGCYALHATGGQLSILCGREPIDEVLERPGLDPEIARRLRLVLDVRRYAFEVFGLEETGSYTTLYDTGEDPIAWNVSACAPDAFALHVWWFPFVGTVPYVGYFDPDPAVDEARRLKDEGLDVLILPVPAYSTLGWFDDPLFSNLLEDPEATLISTVIHELAHSTVWVEGDVELNENLAQFIGDRGAEAFFLARGGPGDPALEEARQQKRDTVLFTHGVLELKEELARVYESTGLRSEKLAYKAGAFRRFRRRYLLEIRPHLSTDGYDWILRSDIELNNAILMTFARYHGEEDLFAALHERCGNDLAATIVALKEIAEEDDPRAALEARASLPK